MKLDSEEAYDKFFIYAVIQGTDHSILGKPNEHFANQFVLVVNIYPFDSPNSTNIIIDYKNYVNNLDHPGKKKKQLYKD